MFSLSKGTIDMLFLHIHKVDVRLSIDFAINLYPIHFCSIKRYLFSFQLLLQRRRTSYHLVCLNSDRSNTAFVCLLCIPRVLNKDGHWIGTILSYCRQWNHLHCLMVIPGLIFHLHKDVPDVEGSLVASSVSNQTYHTPTLPSPKIFRSSGIRISHMCSPVPSSWLVFHLYAKICIYHEQSCNYNRFSQWYLWMSSCC